MKRKRKHARMSGWKLGALALAAAAFVGWRFYDSRQPGAWQRVFATREGQIGDITATRLRIRADSRFVALPHPCALGRTIEVRNADREVVVDVLDVGPWN